MQYIKLFENYSENLKKVRDVIVKKLNIEENDDLTPYYNYRHSSGHGYRSNPDYGDESQSGPIPEIEVYKYGLSVKANNFKKNREYLKSARIKLEIAEICSTQGKHKDKYLLEISAHNLILRAAKEQGEYFEAANVLSEWASKLRKIGQEDDAFMLEETALKIKKKLF